MYKSTMPRYVYCLFCKTGSEQRLSAEIGQRFPDIKPIAAIQEKHKIIDKRYEIDRRTFLPGYLFLYSEKEIDFDVLTRIEEVFKVLGEEAQPHALQGSDRSFAEWLWHNGGVIGISRIRIQNEKVYVLSGPIKYFSKAIIKLDKHTRNAKVHMEFMYQKKEMWLAFEFVDQLTEEEG